MKKNACTMCGLGLNWLSCCLCTPLRHQTSRIQYSTAHHYQSTEMSTFCSIWFCSSVCLKKKKRNTQPSACHVCGVCAIQLCRSAVMNSIGRSSSVNNKTLVHQQVGLCPFVSHHSVAVTVYTQVGPHRVTLGRTLSQHPCYQWHGNSVFGIRTAIGTVAGGTPIAVVFRVHRKHHGCWRECWDRHSH